MDNKKSTAWVKITGSAYRSGTKHRQRVEKCREDDAMRGMRRPRPSRR
jgi:hypothetical protein